MSNKDKFLVILFLGIGILLVTQGLQENSPMAVAAGACSAILMTLYYFWKNREEEEEKEEDEGFSIAELQEIEGSLEGLREWAYKELENRPVKYLHRVFETKEEYRDFLGWVRETSRNARRTLMAASKS